jgi:hypothetical protein
MVTHWQKITKYLYVGKTVNYANRYTSHESSTTQYGDLTRNSALLDMVAVCLLDPEDIDELAYLTEQIFVCLLQTYRKFLFKATAESDTRNNTVAIGCASYFMQVAKVIFERNRWHKWIKSSPSWRLLLRRLRSPQGRKPSFSCFLTASNYRTILELGSSTFNCCSNRVEVSSQLREVDVPISTS